MQPLLRTMRDPNAEMIGVSMPRLGLKRHNASHGVVNALQLTKAKTTGRETTGLLVVSKAGSGSRRPGLE